MGNYIGTISQGLWSYGAIKAVLQRLDTHEYVIGREVGLHGFEHYQFAVKSAGDLADYAESNNLGWHIENAVDWDKSKMYCRKTGQYYEFGDTFEFREFVRIRKRELNVTQVRILESLRDNSDRRIITWIDEYGGLGKSTLLYLLAREGRVCPLLRVGKTTDISDYVAMNWQGEEIIAVDLPRKVELTPELCRSLENVKDGLVTSAKYQGTKKFMRGVKVLVYTNEKIPWATYQSLTKDRWAIYPEELTDPIKPKPKRKPKKPKATENSQGNTEFSSTIVEEEEETDRTSG